MRTLGALFIALFLSTLACAETRGPLPRYQYELSDPEDDVPMAGKVPQLTDAAKQMWDYLYPGVAINKLDTTGEKSEAKKFKAYRISARDAVDKKFDVVLTGSGKLIVQDERAETIESLPEPVRSTATRRSADTVWTSARSSAKRSSGSLGMTLVHELKGTLNGKEVQAAITQDGILVATEGIPRDNVAAIEFSGGLWPEHIKSHVEKRFQLHVMSRTPTVNWGFECFPGELSMSVWLHRIEQNAVGKKEMTSKTALELTLNVEAGKVYDCYAVVIPKTTMWKAGYAEKKEKK
ncbi:MAG TPA: hypothetical protein VGP72_33290 [Planctomycetota bacterium]|jgi:hypothetical protein